MIMIMGACLLGAAIAIFGLNLYQASECKAKSPDELEQFLESINRRLLQAESQVDFMFSYFKILIFKNQIS